MNPIKSDLEIGMVIKQAKKRSTRRRRSTMRSRSQRGGSQRAISYRERALRGLIEFDRSHLRNYEQKLDTLEQDVEVLERKLSEQRQNNAPARKQIQDDMRKKKEEMRVAKLHIDNYRVLLERQLKELAAMEAAAA